jgi:hypothetical protein
LAGTELLGDGRTDEDVLSERTSRRGVRHSRIIRALVASAGDRFAEVWRIQPFRRPHHGHAGFNVTGEN